MSQVPATEALRFATRGIHSRIEAAPFAKALLDKSIHVDAYVGFIRVMAVIHAALEGRLNACEHLLVSQVRSEALRRLPELLEDNEAFRFRLIPDAPGAVQAALKAASHILLISKDNPVALLGCIFGFERRSGQGGRSLVQAHKSERTLTGNIRMLGLGLCVIAPRGGTINLGALEAGAAGYVAKPYKRVDLLATVRSVLDKSGQLPRPREN